MSDGSRRRPAGPPADRATPRAGPDQDVARKRRLAAAGIRTRRLTRTVLLGTLLVAIAILWLVRELGLDADELLGYLVTSLLFVAGAIVLAVLGAALLWLVRRLFR